MRAHILLLALLLACGNAWAEECGTDLVLAKALKSDIRCLDRKIEKLSKALEEIARKMPEKEKRTKCNDLTIGSDLECSETMGGQIWVTVKRAVN